MNARNIAITLAAGMVAGCALLNMGADKNLIVSIEPSTTQVTSENVPFKIVFTNTGDKAISVLKPVMGRDMVISVYDKTGEELARSIDYAEYVGGYNMDKSVEYVSLKPRATWKTEDYELFSATHPATRVAPDQTVRISVTYLLNGKEYKADASIAIPAHDLEIKPGYISREQALDLANQELETRGFKIETLRDIEPEVTCINGIYRVVYSDKTPVKPLVRGGGPVIVSLKVDAITGSVFEVSGGRR